VNDEAVGSGRQTSALPRSCVAFMAGEYDLQVSSSAIYPFRIRRQPPEGKGNSTKLRDGKISSILSEFSVLTLKMGAEL